MKTAMQEAIDFLENELKSLRWSHERMIIMGFAGREFQLAKDISYLKTLIDKEKEQIKNAYNEGYREAELDYGTDWRDDDVADHENAQIYYDETFTNNSESKN